MACGEPQARGGSPGLAEQDVKAHNLQNAWVAWVPKTVCLTLQSSHFLGLMQLVA